MSPHTRILLVDDEHDLRMLVAERLGMEGYAVSEAGKVSDAMRLIEASEYDLLLLDVRLPDGTGLDILKFMRESGNTTPVIMLTGTTGLDIAVESVRLGARDYVTKPAKISYLLHSIRELLATDHHETT
ncbi:MAG: response regulator [Ignavibacteria bacterium]|nr:response regulator [Ignavibacteria bacterium]